MRECLSYDVVMQIVEGLQKEGYIVYTDNFYSSPTLFNELVNQGFGVVGTMDPTRMSSCSEDQNKSCYDQCMRWGTESLFSQYGRTQRW